MHALPRLHPDTEMIDNLTAQLIAAEDTLSQKDKEIERQNKDLEAYNIRCVSRRCLKCA